MVFRIYVDEKEISKQLVEMDNDDKTIEQIVERIKLNGYKIDNKSYKYGLEFDDIVSINENQKVKRKCLIISEL